MANKISKSEELSNYLNALSHPLAAVVNQLRVYYFAKQQPTG
jgi:hypothetical protein